jgi:hypothetical protein
MTIDIINRIDALLGERKDHAAALQAIDDRLGQIQRLLGGSVAISSGKRRGRPPKLAIAGNGEAVGSGSNTSPVTLADHLEVVIRSAGKPLTIADLLAGIKASSYKSKAKDLRPVASLSLIKDKRFQRVARGVYDVK